MTSGQRHIRIGHFDNFKGEASILISADLIGLLELEDVFLKLSNGLPSFDLSNLKLLDKNFRIKIVSFNDVEDLGLRPASADGYEWRATSMKWGEFKAKLTAMYRNGNGGHHYLDSDPVDNMDLQVVFSWDEYPLSFWEKSKTE